MVTTRKTSISIHKPLFDQAESLAQHLNISSSHLIEIAIADFIDFYPLRTSASPEQLRSSSPSVINQGDIFWIKSSEMDGLKTDIPHPHLVIQANVLNHSRLTTVVACALTSNIKRVNIPGNVLLDVGEANLPRHSVVEVSKVSTLDKSQLGAYIGAVTEQRIEQILAGMRLVQSSFFN